MRKLSSLDPATLSSNPRCSLASWLKYQPVVEAAFRQHPKPFIYQPTSHTPATIASRLREAVKGVLVFSYESRVPLTDLTRWWSEVVVRHDREKVWIGPLDAARTEPVSGKPAAATLYSYDTASFEEITAFALLLSNGKLQGPVCIKQPPDVTLLEDRNVQVLKREDGSLVLI